MNPYNLSHLTNPILERELAAIVAGDCTSMARLLAYISEVDERRLYLPKAHPSMYSYCVHVLHYCEQAALKRIRAARAAREFPAIFTAVAEGRVHLSGLVLLASRLTQDNVDEFLAAATHKTSSEIQLFMAQRFPRPDVPTRVTALAPPTVTKLLDGSTAVQLSSRRVEEFPKVAPLGPKSFSLELTMDLDMHDDLRYAQALLGHQLPSGNEKEVIARALKAFIVTLEKTKFAATRRPRTGPQRTSVNPRYVPAHVKSAVWERDGGQCTFVSDAGERCPARKLLEFDHIDEVARGGKATTDRMRLRCRGHNQYEAERTFGTGFMERKRDEARQAKAERRAAAEPAPSMERAAMEHAAVERTAVEQAAAERVAAEHAMAERVTAVRAEAERAAAAKLDVVPYLRKLGFRAKEAQLAAQQCETSPETPLEERVRAALKFLGTKGRTYVPQAARSSGVSGFATP